MERDLAQQAYHTWLTSLYGSTDAAFIKGVKTWENLPEKAQVAWYDTVKAVTVIVLSRVHTLAQQKADSEGIVINSEIKDAIDKEAKGLTNDT